MNRVNIHRVSSVSSTNDYIQSLPFDGCSMLVVVADEQTKGRGCGSNSWESEAKQNLTFSVRYRPEGIRANQQFIISMQAAVAMCRTLEDYGISAQVKWPNDIYVGDKKICGILIENRLQGDFIKETIIGIGLNINQKTFVSDAPNPVSMIQIAGREFSCQEVLNSFLSEFGSVNSDISNTYHSLLYRRQGFYRYRDADGEFTAKILGVAPDGIISLEDSNGDIRKYAFKEISFCL